MSLLKFTISTMSYKLMSVIIKRSDTYLLVVEVTSITFIHSSELIWSSKLSSLQVSRSQ